MSLGILDLITTLTSTTMAVIVKGGAAVVNILTTVETVSRTLNTAATIAEKAVDATASEMNAEYKEHATLMELASKKRIADAQASSKPTS